MVFILFVRSQACTQGWVWTKPPAAPRASFEVTLAAILYTCQEMQYTDTLQTRTYQNAEQLEMQLEGEACILLMHFYE